MDDDEVLTGYLQNHWLGATTGVALFRRVGRTHSDPDVAAEISRMADEIAADRAALREIMAAVGARPSMVATPLARCAAVLGKLKPNGRIIRRSPLTDVLEVEALRIAVTGKAYGWEVLRAAADDDARLDAALLDELRERAADQLRRLEQLHLDASQRRLATAR